MEKEILTQKFAEERRAQINGEIEYGLDLKFHSKAEEFSGTEKIKFFLAKKSLGLRVDTTSEVKKVLVNSQEVKFKKDKFSMTIDEGLKENSENIIEIDYIGKYNHSGEGLQGFIDPEDKREYLYSDSEPYSAHRFYPCFDQPDMKATFKLKVQIPKFWTAVSNEPIESEEILGEEKTISFKKTKKLSTYLFHVSLGEYLHAEDQYKNIPLRIYFRKSLEHYIPKEEFFTITKQGLEFFEKFFDFPYPFSKYDQLFVPEFNSLAMENAGAVTFAESMIKRRKMTHTEKTLLANVILHEMTHMWFGDLVTMKWWGDLWLNESFADFMSYIAMADATEFKNAWEDFYARKAWAYLQDQYSTTHPIATIAADTDVAFSNFDGISYSKGAAVLKQLMFYIGEENFKRGARNYFKKYAWQNTELKDFLECLENASKMNLEKWFDSWIKTTGVNAVTPKISLSGNKISDFKILQEPSVGNMILREHKTKAALFYPKKSDEKNVIYTGKETAIKDFEGREKPDFVFLNYKDFDYAKQIFDPDSLKFILGNIGKVSDDLTRQMLYGSLWEMSRDALLNPREFIELVLKNSPNERNLMSLERMFLKAKSGIMYYISDAESGAFSKKFFELSLKMLDSKIDRELKGTWFGMLLFSSVGAGEMAANKISEILEGKITFNDFEFDQDKRWGAIMRLEAMESPDADKFLEKEKSKDKSDRGEKQAAAAEASSLKNKEKFWKLFVSGKGKSLDYIRTAMFGFYWRNQKDKLRKYTDLFFEDAKKISDEQENQYLKAYFANLSPMLYPDESTLKKAKEFLSKTKKSDKLLIKYTKEFIDDLERIMRARKKFG